MVEDPCLGLGRLSLFLPYHSLARPPSSPTAAWGRRRGGKKKRRQEEEEEKEEKKRRRRRRRRSHLPQSDFPCSSFKGEFPHLPLTSHMLYMVIPMTLGLGMSKFF
jgi:hypothetical protein